MEGWEWGWPAVQAIGTAVLAIGLGFTLLQVWITRKSGQQSNTAQLTIGFLHDFRDEKTKDTLRFIYGLNSNDTGSLTQDEKHKIENTLDKFQLLGTLVKQTIIAGDFTLDLAPAALRCWYKLHNYIREQRKSRGFFYEYYEGYTCYCLDNFKRKGFKVMFGKEGTGENIDLVSELYKNNLRPRSYKVLEHDAKANRN